MSDIEETKHDLADYVDEINLGLQQDYKQIRKRVLEDPGTAGDQVEETWAGVLKKWLPAHFHIVTKSLTRNSVSDNSILRAFEL